MAEPRRSVKVWDVPTRIFHWLLVLLVGVDVLTGYVTPEWWMGVHVWSGYGLAGLMVFRLVWGVFGSEYSRIVSFTYPPRDTFEHLRGLLMLRPPHYVGHNPTGALMVFALTGVLLGLVVTGLVVLGGEEKQGPLAAVVGYSLGSLAKTAHGALVLLLLAMIVAHIIGVVVEGAVIGDNLIRSMVTGWKQLPARLPIPPARVPRPVAAACVVALLVAVAAISLRALAGLPPPHGLRVLAENSTYTRECGGCHYPINPSLLPAGSWAGLMAQLSDHFGDNASLDQPTTRELTMWLVENAAETWDTESANRFRVVAPEEPFRVTATPYWVRKHSGIPGSVFTSEAVRSRVNCNACHLDAATGRYDDQAIRMPKEGKQ
jgi:cytochrome b